VKLESVETGEQIEVAVDELLGDVPPARVGSVAPAGGTELS